MDESSSSDSGERCERFRNVRSLLVKSREGQRNLEENYAYKRRLGDLIFDANFEGANLGRVEQVDAYQYDLMARPDVSSPRHRIWFNFKVSNQRPNQCVVFTLVNLSESLALFSEGLTPVVRRQSRPDWTRLSCNQVFHHRSSSHNNRRVLSLAFRFVAHDDEHQFALFYPYTITTLTEFLNRWQVQLKRQTDESNPTLKILTTSLLSKPIHLLQTQPAASVKLSAIVSLRKSGNFESAASWVVQGLMDFVLSDHPIAWSVRERIHLTVFPMVEPDSRWAGNSRTDLMGQPSVEAKVVAMNPHIYQAHRIVESHTESIISQAQEQAVVVVDLQVGANLIGSRFVGSHFGDSLRMEHHLHLPRLMSRFCDSFYFEKCEFSGAEPENSSLKIDKYQFEVSPLGYYKRSLLNAECRPYEQSDYLLLGKALAYALLELSRTTRQDLPETISETLASFRHKPADVDDLVLVQLDDA